MQMACDEQRNVGSLSQDKEETSLSGVRMCTNEQWERQPSREEVVWIQTPEDLKNRKRN